MTAPSCDTLARMWLPAAPVARVASHGGPGAPRASLGEGTARASDALPERPPRDGRPGGAA